MRNQCTESVHKAITVGVVKTLNVLIDYFPAHIEELKKSCFSSPSVRLSPMKLCTFLRSVDAKLRAESRALDIADELEPLDVVRLFLIMANCSENTDARAAMRKLAAGGRGAVRQFAASSAGARDAVRQLAASSAGARDAVRQSTASSAGGRGAVRQFAASSDDAVGRIIATEEVDIDEALKTSARELFCCAVCFGNRSVLQFLFTLMSDEVRNCCGNLLRLAAQHFSATNTIFEFMISPLAMYSNLSDEASIEVFHSVVETCQQNLVECCLSTMKLDINAAAANQKTALHIAIYKGCSEVIDMLLKIPGIRVNSRTMELATRKSPIELIQRLLAMPSVSVNLETLRDAAKRGDLAIVKLLAPLVNCKSVRTSRESPFHIAADRGDLDIIKYLLTLSNLRHLVFSRCGYFQSAVLHTAAAGGHVEVLRYLIENVHNIEHCPLDADGASPLHRAAAEGHLCAVQYLVNDAKLDVNIREKDDNDTAFCTAVGHVTTDGCFEVVKFLKSAGTVIDRTDHEKLLERVTCKWNAHLPCLQFLVTDVGIDPGLLDEMTRDTPLHCAVALGSSEMVRFLVTEQRVNVHVTNDEGMTVLHALVYINRSKLRDGIDVSLAKFLIDDAGLHVDINALDNDGHSLWWWAIERGRVRLVEYLSTVPGIERGAFDNAECAVQRAEHRYELNWDSESDSD